MNKVSFFLPCIPTAQQRARYTSRGRAYKSEIQASNERTLEALLLSHIPQNAFEGPVEVDCKAIMPIPSSVSLKRKRAMLKGEIAHTKKPDLDNLCKQLLDAMTRMQFWLDDKQIIRLGFKKEYGDVPGWQVNLFVSAR